MLFYFQCCNAYSTGLILIMRDVNNGWAVRYIHANTASFFFIFVYAQTHFYLFYYQNMYSIFNNIDLFCFAALRCFASQKKKIIDDFLNAIKPKPIKSSAYRTISNFKDVEFLQWFVGFSDAESSFIINTKNEREVHFTFQITLHIDDVAVLYTIRGKLGIGVVSIKGNTCRCFFLSSNNGKLITCFLQISFTYA